MSTLDELTLAAADAVESLANIIGSLRCAREWSRVDGPVDVDAARREAAGCLTEASDFADEACEKLRVIGLKCVELSEKGGAL